MVTKSDLNFVVFFLNYRILLHKLFKKFQKEKFEQLYGVFAEITFSRPLLYNRRSHDGNLTNNYRRQGETGFSFNKPTCHRRCSSF